MAVKFYNDESNYLLRGKRNISSWINSCVETEGFISGNIVFIFCDPQKHTDINRQYLGHDYDTDVITFDYSDPGKKTISGDIFINPDTVKENAQIFKVPIVDEMLRVIIHGVLHLCGYKDKTSIEQKQMRAKENYYLTIFTKDFNNKNVLPGN